MEALGLCERHTRLPLAPFGGAAPVDLLQALLG